MKPRLPSLLLALLPTLSLGGEVDVIAAKAYSNPDGSWRFQATLKHADAGWEHYADRWEILDSSGKILATRVLAHPHINEQPFTRSLTSVNIPENNSSLTIRGHDKLHGYGGKELQMNWPP
ncbi:hypothetical protein [Thiolapillus sp.]